MLTLSEAKSDIRDEVRIAFLEPRRYLAPMLGSEGYTLPSLDNLEWTSLNETRKESGLTINIGVGVSNNWLIAPKNKIWTRPLHIQISNGVRNNIIVIDGEHSGVQGHIFLHSHGSIISIGSGIVQPTPLNIRLWSRDHLLFWGHGSTANGVKMVMQGDSTRLIVGDDCMFAEDISIRTSDMHSIIDMRNGSHLNPAQSVYIEPHVWVAQDVCILKGAHLGFGSIVGAQSLVNSEIPRFSLAAGTPAKPIKHNVSWDRRETPSLETLERLRRIAKIL